MRTHTLDGTYEPFRIYWTCYRILRAHDDARAAEVLHTACRLLQVRAAKIEDDGLRSPCLEGVSAHRKLMQERLRLETNDE